MKHEPRWVDVVGVMSGTSLDGIDSVLASFRRDGGRFEWKIIAHHSASFDPALRDALMEVAEGEPVMAEEFASLHYALGEVYATAVAELLSRTNREPAGVGCVGISGQTVYHCGAGTGPAGGVTLQLGSAAVVAERLGVRVVSDFRSTDVAAGGEGAPLVPYADYLLFADEKENRVILNLGGIANLTAIPAGSNSESVVAFDTGPGNMVMDGIVAIVSDGADDRDQDGNRAARGQVDNEMLDAALADEFFSKPPPRSTGREQFGWNFVDRWISEGKKRGLSDDDLVAGACALTAESVVRSIREFVECHFKVDAVYVAGGGACNPTLLEAIATRLDGIRIDTSLELGVAPEYREALAFAVLAHETLHGRASNLPQVTGASRHLVLGQVTGEGSALR